MTGTRLAVAAAWAAGLAAAYGLLAVDWFITSPGVVTPRELHVLVAAVIPLIPVVLLSPWAASGHRLLDPSQNVTTGPDHGAADRHGPHDVTAGYRQAQDRSACKGRTRTTRL
jgi:hypothetical protein